MHGGIGAICVDISEPIGLKQAENRRASFSEDARLFKKYAHVLVGGRAVKPDISLQELLGWDGVSPLRADLHSHSTISDGSFSSAELLQQAASAGLTHLAITNHDTTKGISAAQSYAQGMNASAANQEESSVLGKGAVDRDGGATVYDGGAADCDKEAADRGGKAVDSDKEAADRNGEAVDRKKAASLTYISGIEISAWNPSSGRKVHILGFGLKEDSPAIAALCDPTLRARTENTAWQQEQLEKAGYQLDYELLKKLRSASTGFYKQHLMAALTTDPFTSQEYQTLYRSLFKGDGICKRDISYVDARDAVAAINEDGGVAVLAHPGQLDSYDMVPALVDAGLWGIEKFHPDHTQADWDLCAELADRYGLECTGGSDFHGDFGEVERLGQCMLSID